MYKKFKPVKEYLNFFAVPDENALFREHELMIYDYLLGRRRIRTAKANKVIADYRKFSPSPEKEIELLLSFVETGIFEAAKYRAKTESLYNSVERHYNKLIDLIKQHNLEYEYRKRIAALAEETKDTISFDFIGERSEEVLG